MNPNLPEHNKKTRFSSTNQPAKRGRKPAKWKKWTKDYDVSSDDQRRLATMLIAVKTKKDLVDMLARDDIPFGVWAAGMAALKDASKGGGGFLTKLYEMAFGKIPDKLVAMTEDLTQLLPEERDAEIERLYQDHQDSVRRRRDAAAGKADGAPGGPEETDEEKPGTPEGPDHD
jgi:hypothetical protein